MVKHLLLNLSKAHYRKVTEENVQNIKPNQNQRSSEIRAGVTAFHSKCGYVGKVKL